MSIFTYDKMILAMKYNATTEELEPLVAEACGASEYLFGERCRALCLALCLNTNLSEDQMRRLAKRWPHHIVENVAWGLLMVERPEEPPKPVDEEPGEKDDFELAEAILTRPQDECDSMRAYVIARLIEGLSSPYSFVILTCATRLESMRQESWGWRLGHRMKDARKSLADRLVNRKPVRESRSAEDDYLSYLEMIDFCRDDFFSAVASAPGKYDGDILLFLWEERDRFQDYPGYARAMGPLAERVAFGDVSAFWAAPWMAEVIRAYGSPNESIKSMCAILASGILSPEQESTLLAIITEKRKNLMLTQETPCPTNP